MSNYPEKTYPYCNPKPATRWLHYTIYINITLIILLVLFQFSRILFVNQVTFGTEEARTPIATLLNFLAIHKDYILAIYHKWRSVSQVDVYEQRQHPLF